VGDPPGPRTHRREGSAPTRARCRGFSLLEVLVAFAVLALTMGVLFQVFSTGLRTAMVAEEYGEATRMAQSLLTEYAATRPLQAGDHSGSFDGTPYRWQAEISPMSTGDIAPGAAERFETYSVSVRVSWSGGAGERQVDLHTVRLEARP
jgi:general secretion pathway protein I